MSEFNTETITDRAGTGKPDLTFGFKINGSDSGINPFLPQKVQMNLLILIMEMRGLIQPTTYTKSILITSGKTGLERLLLPLGMGIEA